MESLRGLLSDEFLEDYGERIGHLSKELAIRLESWAAATGLRRDISFSRLALTISATAPFASIETLEPPAKCGLLVVALDDLFDDPNLDQVDLRRHLALICSALHGEPAAEDEPISSAVAGLRRDLAGYSLFRSLYPDWRIAFTRLIEGMRRERSFLLGASASIEQALPSYNEYLGYASYSIGVPLYAMTGAITIGDGSLLERMPEFRELAETAGRAVRLANDLATRGREKNEKQVNAVTLKCRETYGESTEETLTLRENLVRSEVTDYLGECRRLALCVQTDSGKPEQFLVDLASVVCAFYGIGDY